MTTTVGCCVILVAGLLVFGAWSVATGHGPRLGKLSFPTDTTPSNEISSSGNLDSGGLVANTLPLVPITPGTAVAGDAPDVTPITWSPATYTGTSLSPVAGGVNFTINQVEHTWWQGVPVEGQYLSMEVQSTVQMTSGPTANGIGLVCDPEHLNSVISFREYSASQYWYISYASATGGQYIDSGNSSVIVPAGANTLMIECAPDAANSSYTHVMFEINGQTVFNGDVVVAAEPWSPAIVQCSCSGADTGTYTDMTVYQNPANVT